MVKKGKKDKDSVQLNLPSVPDHLMKRIPKRWVTVHFKLMGFSALDAEVRLPQSSTLHMVESKIIAHHGGSIGQLSMWRDRIEPNCVIRDFGLTLRDVFNFDDTQPRLIPGIQRRPIADGELEDHHVVIYYDYRAHDSDCPLLLRSPRYPKILDQQLANLEATKKA
jgi:hypothetical protein